MAATADAEGAAASGGRGRLRVAFAGTPEFARVALRDLLSAGFDVPLVLTQPDRPAGRGMKLQASPVKQLAQQHAIPVVSRAVCASMADTLKTRQRRVKRCWPPGPM